MFDIRTATPAQIEHQLWHLTEQRICLYEVGFEFTSIPDSEEDLLELGTKLDALDAEIETLERRQQELTCAPAYTYP